MAKTNWQAGDTVQPADMNQMGQEINAATQKANNAVPLSGGTMTGRLNVPGINQLRAQNFKAADALPSTYDVGETMFFVNQATGWPSSYGTVSTIKGHTSFACVQYFYPYNEDAPIKYRYCLYNSDSWTPWREVLDTRTGERFAVTTNSGSAYSATYNPAPSALTPGLRVVIKANVANSGAATLNVNGLGAKGIKKANGSDANLKAGGVYTLIYDGTNFILQGEGGEIGTATAGDVRAGKTIGGDELITGTLPVQATGPQTITPGASNIVKGAGIYDGIITILGDAGLVPGNIPKDISLFGVQGILERMTTAEKQGIADAITGKGVPASVNDLNTVLAQKIGQIKLGSLYATGTATVSNTNTLEFTRHDGVVVPMKYLQVSGLNFLPKTLLVVGNDLSIGTGYGFETIYRDGMKFRYDSAAQLFISSAASGSMGVVLSGNAYLTSTGFLVPVNPYYTNHDFSATWYAFGD